MSNDLAPNADVILAPPPKPLHLFVSTLVGGGRLWAQHAQCCEALRTVCARRGIGLTLHRNGGTGVDRARNREVAFFREKTECTHHLQLDDDVCFDPEDIVRMMQSNLDVCGMVYPRKEIDWQQVADAVMRGTPVQELEKYASSFIFNPLQPNEGGGYDGREIEGIGTFMAVMEIGTGCLMVRREAYDRFIERYKAEIAYRTDYPPYLATHYRVFGCEITQECEREKAKAALLEAALLPERSGDLAELAGAYAGACADDSTLGRYDTEDWSFCGRWRAMGGQIYVFIDGTLEHQGSYTYRGNIRRVLNLSEKGKPEPKRVPQLPDRSDAMVTIPRASLWSVAEVCGEYDLWQLPDMEAPRVLDIGANVGIFALRSIARWPDATVESWEPHPDSFKLLCANVDGRAVCCLQAAVTHGVPMGTGFLHEGRNALCRSLHERPGETVEGGVDVDLCDSASLDACDVLKVDTEGSEVEILEGYKHLGTVKALLVETHRKEDVAKIQALAKAAGLTQTLPTVNTTLRFLRPEQALAEVVVEATTEDLPALDAHEIVPGLWMGGYPTSWQAVIRDGFQTLVVTAQERAAAPALKGVELYAVPFGDSAQMEMTTLNQLIDMAAIVGEHVLAGKKVLVTCNEGRNRSGLLVGLAIHAMSGMSGHDAIALIRKQRVKEPQCLSNALFANILGKLKALPEKGEPCIVCGARPAPHRYDHGDDGPYCSEHAASPSADAEVTAHAE